ncbi:MAG: zf-HC2 domain-containing protein [Fuerstia sp.]|nr:zf-HC2 domain-containing protein [Fuerstiella sp.]
MVMNCSEAKHLIHLDVGDDLRAEEEHELATHMEQCGDCRAYHVGMSSAMATLLTLRDDPALAADGLKSRSVWPSLSREIARRSTSPRVARKFNLQVAALSVCSLSLAVVTMVQSLSSMRNEADPMGFMPSQAISHQPPVTPFPPVYHDSQAMRTLMLPDETPVSLPRSF